jgi:NADPH2:quinone reductase
LPAEEETLMQAVQAARFGDPTVLSVVELPDPVPGPGQIAIDVTHAAVGLVDVFLRQGQYKDRPGLPQPPFVPGLEVAGTVRALGDGVTGFTVGEHVVTMSATGAGGYASVYVGSADGTVRTSKLAAASATKLPYDQIVDSAELPDALGGEKFDVVIDPVGGSVRTVSLDLMTPGGRLLASGNASGDWGHRIDSNQLWLRSLTVAGFSSGAYLPAHPEAVRPALEAALSAVAAGLGDTEIDVLPFSAAVTAHERMESRDLNGRIVLTPDPVPGEAVA